MQIFGPKVSLERFRDDGIHRQTMCEALAEDAPTYAPIATAAQGSVLAIDAKKVDVRRIQDLLIRARALELVRKVSAQASYAQLRRDLAAEAAALYRTLLPTPPSALGRAGAKRAVMLVEAGVASVRSADMPESVRAEHLPGLERALTRLREADLAEDEAEAALIAARAGVLVFKANRQAERELQYGALVSLAGSRAAADAFFLPAYSAPGGADDGDEDTGDAA